MLPASTFQLTEPLSVLCSKGEKALGLEVCVCLCACAFILYILDWQSIPSSVLQVFIQIST